MWKKSEPAESSTQPVPAPQAKPAPELQKPPEQKKDRAVIGPTITIYFSGP